MNYHTIELDDKEIKFRLTSEGSIAIEESTQMSIFDTVANLTMKNVITLLTYMRKSEEKNFSRSNACALYDELINHGYTLERVGKEIIFPTLVVSGFLTQDELDKITANKEK